MKNIQKATNAVLAVVLIAAAPALGQTVRDVVSFSGNNAQGLPNLAPEQGRNGDLYGTCPNPDDSAGSAFNLTLGGNLIGIYTFSNATGNFPDGLTLASDGNFYGVTVDGGKGAYGTLFRMSPKGAYTVLHSFIGGADGAGPFSPPIEGSDGNFYGTTSGASGIFRSTVYRYSPSGGFSTIYEFNRAQAYSVGSQLTQGSDGNLYGTSFQGGEYLNGSIFKLSTSGKLLYLYSMPMEGDGKFGTFPDSPLIQASDGNFYGTAYSGGSRGEGDGTIFKMDQSGVVSVLYTFAGNIDGSTPTGVMQATDGNLYGTTYFGGVFGYGTFFQMSLSGEFKTIYSFTSAIGENPSAAPLQDTNGLFYGPAPYGSTYGFGAIYSVDMGLGPFITFVRPNGKTGQTAEILGQGLTGASSVTFNGVQASSFKVESDTYMTAAVPDGATTGLVSVVTPAGALTSNKNFQVLP